MEEMISRFGRACKKREAIIESSNNFFENDKLQHRRNKSQIELGLKTQNNFVILNDMNPISLPDDSTTQNNTLQPSVPAKLPMLHRKVAIL